MELRALKLFLVDPYRDLCESWRKHFRDLPQVAIVNGKFEDLPEFDGQPAQAKIEL